MMGTIGNEIIRLHEVDSTNRYLMDWINRENVSEGTVVITDFQTAGRGTDGARWESEQSKNLTFSLLLKPVFLAPEAQFYLNKVISLGLADAVNELLPGRTDIRVKWPNDLYLGDRKVAGTLIQNGVKGSRFEFSILGIGLNVNQSRFTDDAANPVSLNQVSGKIFDLPGVLELVLKKIEARYECLKKGDKTCVDADYLKVLYRFNEMARFIVKEKPVEARITGVNRYGQLILEIPGSKILECDLKEVKFEI